MRLDCKNILWIILLAACPIASYAADMLGNPTFIGTPGQVAIEIGGGKSSNFSVDIEKTTATVTMGNLSGVELEPAIVGTNSEDQVFIGATYAINTKTQLFAYRRQHRLR